MPEHHLLRLFQKYRDPGVLIDANLLLVFLVGRCHPDLISQCKRTRAYRPEDFDTLSRVLGWFRNRFTTPNVLTEVSNLGAQVPAAWREPFWRSFAGVVGDLDEQYIPSRAAIANPALQRLGLTDIVITRVLPRGILVLTDDLDLSLHVQSTGRDAVNFNHLRQWSS